MQIYNTLTRTKEEIVPREPGRVTLYSCGPTVYRYIHIGNLRTFTMADWLRRALAVPGSRRRAHQEHHRRRPHAPRSRSTGRRQDDRAGAQARAAPRPRSPPTTPTAFHEDEQRLNILPADVFPRATDHIAEMIAMIAALLERRLRLRGRTGTSTSTCRRFPGYGELARQHARQALARQRAASDRDKRHPARLPAVEGAPSRARLMAWRARGARLPRLAHRVLGHGDAATSATAFDIHTGGVDNIFPHHEDEIAQSEASTGEPLRCVLGARRNTCSADGLKMAKSHRQRLHAGRCGGARLRAAGLALLLHHAHYRSRINFTFRALTRGADGAAPPARARPAPSPPRRRQGEAAPEAAAAGAELAQRWRERFLAAIDDDLNLPRAMAVLWEVLRPGEVARSVPARARLDLAARPRPHPGLRPGRRHRRVPPLGRAAAWRDQPAPGGDAAPRGRRAPAGSAPPPARRRRLRPCRRPARPDRWPRAGRAGHARRYHGAAAPGRGPARSSRAPADAPDHRAEPDRYASPSNLLAHNSRDDLRALHRQRRAQRRRRAIWSS